MAFDIGEIRTALAEKIGGYLSGVNVHDYPPDAPELPCILIRPSGDGVDYHLTFGPTGLASVQLEVEIRVSGWDEDAARQIDRYLGSGTDQSVFDAIYANNYDLSPVVASVSIIGASAPQRVQSADGAMSWLSTRILLTAYERRPL